MFATPPTRSEGGTGGSSKAWRSTYITLSEDRAMVTEAETATSLATGAPVPRTEFGLDQTVPAGVEAKRPVLASKTARSGSRHSSASDSSPKRERDCRHGRRVCNHLSWMREAFTSDLPENVKPVPRGCSLGLLMGVPPQQDVGHQSWSQRTVVARYGGVASCRFSAEKGLAALSEHRLGIWGSNGYRGDWLGREERGTIDTNKVGRSTTATESGPEGRTER